MSTTTTYPSLTNKLEDFQRLATTALSVVSWELYDDLIDVGIDFAAPMRVFFFPAAGGLLHCVDSRKQSKEHTPIHRHSILPCSAERSQSPHSGHLLTATTWQTDANA
mmetsp:Transcript_62528/g.152239  ORF Transcript_62528/g.152239 Transcript_62528/m.152239 type:complete len:108 (-) Transcript_62528:205-528(-)